MNNLLPIKISDYLLTRMNNKVRPNMNRMMSAEALKISRIGKADDVIDTGDGKITRGAANTLPIGTGVGVAILPGVISSSSAKTSAFAW
jgi:hypothetical protein